jgi:hypothetical protein
MEPDDFEDIFTEIRGDSCRSHDRAVVVRFDKFLQPLLVNQDRNDYLGALTETELRRMYGQFANYLFDCFTKETKPGHQTAMNYLSALKVVLQDLLFDGKAGIFTNWQWYTGVRHKLTQKYVDSAQKTGIPLHNSPDDLTEELLERLGLHLFTKGTRKAISDRAIMSLLYNLLGCIKEIGYLRLRHYQFKTAVSAVTVSLLRTKGNHTGTVKEHALYPQRLTWKHCVLHSLGSTFILNPQHLMMTNASN